MDYQVIIQYFAILLPILACFGFLYRELKEFKKEIKIDIAVQSKRMDTQSARSDKLYEMFIDLVKAKGGKK
jgi:hypothetical protein